MSYMKWAIDCIIFRIVHNFLTIIWFKDRFTKSKKKAWFTQFYMRDLRIHYIRDLRIKKAVFPDW